MSAVDAGERVVDRALRRRGRETLQLRQWLVSGAIGGLPVRDLLLGTVFAAWSVISLGQVATPATARPWIVLAALLWVGPLVLRTVAPLAMAALVTTGEVAYGLVPGAPDWAPFEAALVIAFSLGLHLSGRRLWLAGLLVTAGGLASELMTVPFHGVMDTYASVPLIVGAPAAAGLVLQRERARTAALRKMREELEAERESRSRDAAAAERNRIARDLHDVIAHTVSVMVVQAGAAETRLPEDAPAREQLRAVRRTGRQTLTELRRQLLLLRGGEP